MEQKLLTRLEHMSSLPDLSGIRVARSFVFCVMFCRSLLLSFFLWSLCCLSFYLRLLIAPLYCLSLFYLSLLVTPLWCLSFFYLRLLITPLCCLFLLYLWLLISPLCCLSFFYLRLLITPLVSSNFSYARQNSVFKQKETYVM